MKYLFLFSFLIAFALSEVIGQTRYQVFLDKNEIPTDESGAIFKRSFVQLNDSLFKFTDQYNNSDQLFQVGTVILLIPESLDNSIDNKNSNKNKNEVIPSEALPWNIKMSKHGEITRYHKNGSIEFVGSFHNNRLKGLVEYYYESGLKKAEYIHEDSLFKIDHEYLILNYYDSMGNTLVKDGEGWLLRKIGSLIDSGNIQNGLRHGKWIGAFNNGKSPYEEFYENGNLISGTSKDSIGNSYEYESISKMPEYQGGMQEFYRFVSQNMEYPVEARRRGIQGKVFVQFVVDKYGNTTEVKTVKGIYSKCDQQAERVIDKANNFVPGRFRGQETHFRMILPIVFNLQ